MSLSPAFLDELRGRTQLSALIAKSLKLERAGREFRACCPFHNEKSPSFYVNDDKGFYHCFGCGAHGDAIRWMTDQRGLPFIDAVKDLAATAGMDMPAPDPRAAARAERATSLHDVMAASAEFFADQLASADGAGTRAYLKARGITPDLAKTFGLGFAPDNRGALKRALARFDEAMLTEAGMLIEVDGKERYDRFRGRLMIPIRDPRGRVIAFGGRILGAGEPKYLNSPDTPLFDKGRTLYNLDRAAAASRKSGRLILVEGYMDVIALAAAGIDEAVAPLGTALTEHQIERAWRLTDVPILCFDGDNAGQKAAMRAALRALPALQPGRSLAFVTLPPSKDPDDVVRSEGRAAMETLLKSATPMVERIWTAELGAAPVDTPEARAGLRKRLDTHVQTIADPEVRRHYARALRERFDERFFAPGTAQPFRRMPRGRLPDRPLSARARTIGSHGVDFSQEIMAGILRHPQVILSHGETIARLAMGDRALARLRDLLIDHAYDASIIETSRIETICAEAGLGGLLGQLRSFSGLAFSFTRDDSEPETAVADLARAIEALAARPELDAALTAATARVAEGGDEEMFAEQVRLRRARDEADRTLAMLRETDDGI